MLSRSRPPICDASVSTPVSPFRPTFVDSNVLQAQAAHALAQVPFQHLSRDVNARAHARVCSGCSTATMIRRPLMMQYSSRPLKSGHKLRLCACLHPGTAASTCVAARVCGFCIGICM